ncbi:MAG: hemerythrin domain-containing protein [Sciscionella sp.]
MPDICDLILDEHERFRRRFAELDEQREAGGAVLSRLWEPLAATLDRHAAAEEAVFYPALLERGTRAEDETDDAVGDHNKIRDAVRDSGHAETGSAQWWEAVWAARRENSEHMGEEERGALADFRANTEPALRDELGTRFTEFNTRHASGQDVDTSDKDPQRYIEENTPTDPT